MIRIVKTIVKIVGFKLYFRIGVIFVFLCPDRECKNLDSIIYIVFYRRFNF